MRNVILFLFALIFTQPVFATEKLVLATGQKGILDNTFSEYAEKTGFLKKCDVVLSHNYGSSGTEALSAVFASSADIAISPATTAAIGSYTRGANIAVIGSTFTGIETFWYVKSSSSFKTLEDLKGRRLGNPSPGSWGHILNLMLEDKLKIPLQHISMGSNSSALYVGIMTDQLDAATVTPPTFMDKVISGDIRIIGKGGEIFPEQSNTTVRVLVADRAILEKKKETIKCWINAVNESIDYFFDTDDGALQYANLTGYSFEIVKFSKTYLKRINYKIRPATGIQTSVEDGLKFKFITQRPTEEQLNNLFINLN
jgi:ABC-type nitrate/sulfonate/bicarbonate transport system substrate-binding protein